MFKAKPAAAPENKITYNPATQDVNITGPVLEFFADAETFKLNGKWFIELEALKRKIAEQHEKDKAASKPYTPPQDPRDPGPGAHLFGPRNEDC